MAGGQAGHPNHQTHQSVRVNAALNLLQWYRQQNGAVRKVACCVNESEALTSTERERENYAEKDGNPFTEQHEPN